MVPAVMRTHKETDVFPNDTTMNTARPLTFSMTIFLPLLPLLPPHTRNPVKGTSFVYKDGSFGLSFKNYTTHVLVALARVLNGLRQSCKSYQWQYGLSSSFITRVFTRRHQLGSCCLASYINFLCTSPFPSCPHCSFCVELCCNPTLYFRPWHTWCQPMALPVYGFCLRQLFCAKTELLASTNSIVVMINTIILRLTIALPFKLSFLFIILDTLGYTPFIIFHINIMVKINLLISYFYYQSSYSTCSLTSWKNNIEFT